MSTLKEAINRAQLGTLADAFRKLGLGDILRALPAQLIGVAPATGNLYVGTTMHVVTLPTDAKAMACLAVYARAGGGTLGPLVANTHTAPDAGSYFINPTGDIEFAIADAWTKLDIVYFPAKVDVTEQTFPVVAHTATIPAVYTAKGVQFAMQVESLVGTLVAKMIVDPPGTAPASGHAALNLAKTTIVFNAADVVTSCRVLFGVGPAIDVNALLESTDTTIL